MRTLSTMINGKNDAYFVISFDYDPQLVEQIRKIPGRKFDKKTKSWMTRADHISAKYVDVYCKFFGFEMNPDAIELIAKLLKPIDELNIELPPLKMELRPFQKLGVAYATKYERCIIADEMGLGKAQSIYSGILTPSGWKQFKDIGIGDEIMGPSGGIFNITGVYPQGTKKLYKVIFSDGASTITCGEHLWSVQTALQKYRNTKYTIKNLDELKNDLKKPGKNRNNLKWFIPITNALRFKERDSDFYIHPYILGVLIGDGSLTHGASFTSEDDDIVLNVKNKINGGFILKKRGINDFHILNEENVYHNKNKPNLYIRELNALGLLNCKSEHKFIPDNYKFSSVNDRIELLNGLMDTDGYISKSGDCVQYYTVSESLKNDMVFLLQSLGCVVRTSIKITSFSYKNEIRAGQNCHVLTINFPPSLQLFKLNRKKDRIQKNKKYIPCRGIKFVEYVGNGEAVCIRTNSPDSLYITDDCIVTHNTAESIAAVETLNAYPCLVVCPASLKLNWQKEINMWVNRTTQIISGLVDEDNPPKYDSEFVIINYDIISRGKNSKDDDDLKDSDEKENAPLTHKDFLSNFGFKSIITDESHYIKNYKSNRTRAIKKIAKGIKYRFALTGTPLLNKPKELMPQLEMLEN